MPIFNFRNPIEYPLGLLELLASGATGAAGQVAGVPIGLLKSADKYGTQEGVREAEKEAQRVSSALTYLPRTETAREMAGLLGKAMEASKLPPVMPEAQSLLALSQMPKEMYVAQGMNIEKAAEPVVRQIMERGGMPASLLEGMSSRTVSPLTVYHGSPAKFERFDPTKIGSGEGAQAYGYGHYVAESPGVAKDYQRRLAKESQATDLNTKMQMVDVGGKPLTSFNVDMDASLLDAAKAGKTEFVNLAESKKARWQSLSQDQSYPFQDYAKQKVEGYTSLLDAAKKSDVDYTGTGMFYEIDLPDEQIARMLDFDKPLMQQSKEIQALAKQYGLTDADHMGGDLIAAMDAKRPAGAELMRQAGVPGIRYLDQGSRATPNITNQRLADLYEKHQGNAEAAVDEMMRSVYNTPKKKQEMRDAFLKQLEAKKTSNFVVFPGNEGLLTIQKRNNEVIAPTSLLDYRGSHTAPGPDFGAPLHDLTGGGQMYPADVYSPKAAQYYGTGYPKADKEAFDLAKRVKGNPDAEVTMYRAVPNNKDITDINAGDWVTLSKDYAKTHGESVLGDYKIISKRVKAKDLWTNADSIHEFGYHPSE